MDTSHKKISRPLSYLTFALNYLLGGKEVFGYHAFNFITHYLTAVFLFLLIYNTLQLPLFEDQYKTTAYPIALLSTFLWATHPIQVTAVTYIVQRMASMAALFYIMSMYFYSKARLSKERVQRILLYSACSIAALCSFASKENAVMLPLTILFFDLFLIQGVCKKTVKKNLLFFIAPILVLMIIGFSHANFSAIIDGYKLRPFTLTERLLTEPRVIFFYITLLLYPLSSRLAFLYDFPVSTGLYEPWTTLPAIILIIAIPVIALFMARRHPLISFCILFFFLNHLIEGSILPLEIIYEHRNYLPSMFFFVLIAVFLFSLLKYFASKKTIQIGLIFMICFVITTQGHTAYMRNKQFRNEKLFWLNILAKSPNLSRAHGEIGRLLLSERNRVAIVELSEALRLENYANLSEKVIYHYNLGSYYLMINEDSEMALKHFREAQKTGESNDVYAGIAVAMLHKGEIELARENIMKAISNTPHLANYHSNFALILLKEGKYKDAINESLTALEKYGYNQIQTMRILAEAYRQEGNNNKALYYLNKILEEQPKDIISNFALIEIYGLTGEKERLKNTISQLLSEQSIDNIIKELNKLSKKSFFIAYSPDNKTILSYVNNHKED